MEDVLFCSDDFGSRYKDRLASVASGVTILQLVDGVEVGAEELERITIAHFSHELWPDRTSSFFGAVLQAINLNWLHSSSVGVDSPVFAELLERGVRLSNSSGSSAIPISRTVMMYLLALVRDLPALFDAQRRSSWEWRRWRELAGRSIAVVGWGSIGQEVARMAEVFGMRVTIVRQAAQGDEPHPVRRLSDLVSVAEDHDVMVVALPLTDATRGIVNRSVLDALGPVGLFVNVGRGELVDQSALTAALVDGRLGGAGIDVTVPEPLPEHDPLWSAPNLIITPHNSGSTDGTGQRADEIFFDNLTSWVDSERLTTEVTMAR